MKKDIHPQFHVEAEAKCSNCAAVFSVGSIKESITVEICRSCHPFYSGKEVVLDTAGRVDKFKKRAAAKQA
ncbi:MAG: ribosomal protein large subunit ribosomal protein [Candidatus Parcubacteria bacterium]|jgi:large subunit ribosomal protein L31